MALARWPKPDFADEGAAAEINWLVEAISEVRSVRAEIVPYGKYEAEEQGGWMNGFTENYIKVKTEYDPLLVNEIAKVKLLSVDADGEVNIEMPVFVGH